MIMIITSTFMEWHSPDTYRVSRFLQTIDTDIIMITIDDNDYY